MLDTPLVVKALRNPQSVAMLSLSDWDLLVRQARAANLLAPLACRVDDLAMMDQIPEAPRHHLQSSRKEVEQQQRGIFWEILCVREALAKLDVPVVLLKGAAYLVCSLPIVRGRSFSDVDILVPKISINTVESELLIHGWIGARLASYDQRYYREWMHEIPPMNHPRRHTAVDVHHSILPETARVKVRSSLLFDRLQPVPESSGRLFVLHPVDMVLHSATHLFHEGELEKGLRDLFDLDGLLRHFGAQPGFWESLVPRAVELGLARPLYYALRYTSALLETPIPPEVHACAKIGRPSPGVAQIMDFCYHRALRPAHTSCTTSATAMTRLALYVRSHWIRMPVHLLLPHLLRKALKTQ